MRRRWGLAALAIVLMLVAGWLSMSPTPSGSDAQVVPLHSAKAPAPREHPRSERRHHPEEQPLDEARLAELYDEVGLMVRCDVGGVLDDGVYSAWGAEGPAARYLQVRDGVLTAAVPTPSGEARVSWYLAPVGVLSWSGVAAGEWGACQVRPVERVEVRGTLRYADGAPAEDFAVRGCVHGEFARTDAEGRWVSEGVVGTTCEPMAFVEAADGRFGKTEPVYVEVEAPGPVQGVELTLPTSAELWNVEQQRELASQLAHLVQQRVDEQNEVVERARELFADVEDEALARFGQRFVEHEELLLERMYEQIERLDDPDEAVIALQEAWLNLY